MNTPGTAAPSGTVRAAHHPGPNAFGAALRGAWYGLRWHMAGWVPTTAVLAVGLVEVSRLVETLDVSMTSVVGFSTIIFAVSFAAIGGSLLQQAVRQGVPRRAALQAGAALHGAFAIVAGVAMGVVSWWEQARLANVGRTNPFGNFVSSATDPVVVGVQTAGLVAILTLIVWLVGLVAANVGVTWAVVVGVVAMLGTGAALGSSLDSSATGVVTAVVGVTGTVVVLAALVTWLGLRTPIATATPWGNSHA